MQGQSQGFADRFSEVTRAYDLLSDKDQTRARFDRGEIDIDGNPSFAGFGGGFGRGAALAAVSAVSAG